jgi:hypothetical protein
MRFFKTLSTFADSRLIPQYFRQLLNQHEQSNSDLALHSRLLANQELDSLKVFLKSNDSKRLEPYGFKGFSQNDEDGIIGEIFNRIGTVDKTFVEFGTGNGLENNTLFLLKQDWCGLWLEGSTKDHQQQTNTFIKEITNSQLRCVNSFLTTDNINSVIESAGFRGEIDLLSIDVDGNDYHLWKSISVVQPRVVVIEYNAYIPPPIRWITLYKQDYVWDGKSTYFSASLSSMNELADSLGYSLVSCNITGLNAFFVRNDLLQNKFCDNRTPAELFHPRRWWLDICYKTNSVDLTIPHLTKSLSENPS